MTTAPLRRPPVPPAVFELLERSRATLEAACRTSDASERYLDAHLGALRAAAALVAARTTPSPRSRPRSVWQVLPTLAPDLGEWATFFAGTSSRRSVIDRGGWLSPREADDLLRQAEMFLEIVQDQLGIPQTVPLPDSITPVGVSRSARTIPIPITVPAASWPATSAVTVPIPVAVATPTATQATPQATTQAGASHAEDGGP